jgi:hypothetical protein
MTVVRRTSDSAAKTDNTLANDDTLLWAVAANEVWFFEGFLLVSAANATMDFKCSWTVPSGTTMSWGGVGGAANSSAIGGYQGTTLLSQPNSIGGAASVYQAGTPTGTFGVSIAGIVVVSNTAGNVNLEWAQATTDAGELKLLTNSILIVRKLA